MNLSPAHRRHLYDSGLSDTTIAGAGFYTESNPAAVARLLNWKRPAVGLGACLVIPFHKADGSRNGFCRVRPDVPRATGGKYEQPAGVSPKPYFPLGTAAVLADATAPVGLCEGEKKALAASQAGCPCIGLCGVWAWQKPFPKDGEKGPRELTAELAEIAWEGRPVWIAFDADERRNPNVAQAAAELGRVLANDHGAQVVFIDLPNGPRGSDGMPTKQGADDYIVRHGPEAFARLVDAALAGEPPARSLDDWRGELAAVRVASVGTPGIFLDTSPTGSGKSYADLPALKLAERSLTILPTHFNARETESFYAGVGLNAKSYPQLDNDSCRNIEEALRALSVGLSPTQAVCLSCEYRSGCEYQKVMAAAVAASHSICTHSRASLSFRALAEGKAYVAIHEDCTHCLRPVKEIHNGLRTVARIAEAARHQASDAGDNSCWHYFWVMGEAAAAVADELAGAESTTELALPTATAGNPPAVDAWLWRAVRQTEEWPNGDAMKICKGLAAGSVDTLTVRVDSVFRPGGAKAVRKALLAVWRAEVPKSITCWLNDATSTRADVEALAGCSVQDKTPRGRIKQRHPVFHLAGLDVKRSSAPGTVVKVVRGVLARWPEFQRVGVIADRNHLPAILGHGRRGVNLEPEFRRRIVKTAHYRGGESRGSNDWLDSCDALIVLGTPRVPPSAVRTRLIQTGNVAAAGRDGAWGKDFWPGIDAHGRRWTVKTLGYRDHDWHGAHAAIVRAELVQSIGRARSILETGLPTVVVSNEPLGLPTVLMDVLPLGDGHLAVLQAVHRLTGMFSKGIEPAEDGPLSGMFPNRYSLENVPVSTPAIAAEAGIDERRARRILNELAEGKLVERIGNRGGWKLTYFTTPSGKAGPAGAEGAEGRYCDARMADVPPGGGEQLNTIPPGSGTVPGADSGRVNTSGNGREAGLTDSESETEPRKARGKQGFSPRKGPSLARTLAKSP